MWYGAVDIGGTKIAAGLGDGSGRIIAQAEVETHKVREPAQAMDWIARTLEELVQGQGRRLADLEAVGVGCPGPFRAGKIYRSPHLPSWDGLDVGRALGERIGRPVFWQNDASAAALGEWRFGVGQGSRSMVYVTVSTGIGSGIVVEGRPYWGANGNAGEIGHVVVDPQGPPCDCGRRGCLETLASGTAIARQASEQRMHSPFLSQAEAVTTEMVFEAWRRGDPVAEAVLSRAVEALGLALSHLLDLINPELLVLGGGVMQAGEDFFSRVRASCQLYALPSVWEAVRWKRAGPSAHTGLIGALALALAGESLPGSP